MKKFFLISIAAILLIVVCGPFVPPIYNRYTKPLWKNYMAGKVSRFHGETEYIPIGTESEGCFTVSSDCVGKVMEIYQNSSKQRPVMVFAKYEK